MGSSVSRAIIEAKQRSDAAADGSTPRDSMLRAWTLHALTGAIERAHQVAQERAEMAQLRTAILEQRLGDNMPELDATLAPPIASLWLAKRDFVHVFTATDHLLLPGQFLSVPMELFDVFATTDQVESDLDPPAVDEDEDEPGIYRNTSANSKRGTSAGGDPLSGLLNDHQLQDTVCRPRGVRVVRALDIFVLLTIYCDGPLRDRMRLLWELLAAGRGRRRKRRQVMWAAYRWLLQITTRAHSHGDKGAAPRPSESRAVAVLAARESRREIGWPRLQEYMRRAALAIMAAKASSSARQQQVVIEGVRAALDEALCAMSWPPHVISKEINRQLANRLRSHTMVRDLEYYARAVSILRVGRPQGHLLGASRQLGRLQAAASFRFDPSSSSSLDTSSSSGPSSSGSEGVKCDGSAQVATEAASTDSDSEGSMGSAGDAIGVVDDGESTALLAIGTSPSAPMRNEGHARFGAVADAPIPTQIGGSASSGSEADLDTGAPTKRQGKRAGIRKVRSRKHRSLGEDDEPDVQDGPSTLTVVSSAIACIVATRAEVRHNLFTIGRLSFLTRAPPSQRHVAYLFSVIGRVARKLHLALDQKRVSAAIDTQRMATTRAGTAGSSRPRRQARRHDSAVGSLLDREEKRIADDERKIKLAGGMMSSGSVASIASVMRAAVKMTPASVGTRHTETGMAAALARVTQHHEKLKAKADVSGADKHIARVRSRSPSPTGDSPSGAIVPAGRGSPGAIQFARPFASPLQKRIVPSRKPQQRLPRGAKAPAATRKERIEKAKDVLSAAVTIAGTTQALLKSTTSFRKEKAGRQAQRRRSSLKEIAAFGHHNTKQHSGSRHDLGALAAEANKGKGSSGMLGTKRKSASTSAKVAQRRRSVSHMGRARSGVNLLDALRQEAAKGEESDGGQMSEPEPSTTFSGLSTGRGGKRHSIAPETSVPGGAHRRFRRKSSMVIVKAAQANRQQLLKRLGRFQYMPSRAASQLTSANYIIVTSAAIADSARKRQSGKAGTSAEGSEETDEVIGATSPFLCVALAMSLLGPPSSWRPWVSRHRTKSWSKTRLEAELLRRSELQVHATAHSLSVERCSAVHALAVWQEDVKRQLDHEEAVCVATERARQRQSGPQLGALQPGSEASKQPRAKRKSGIVEKPAEAAGLSPKTRVRKKSAALNSSSSAPPMDDDEAKRVQQRGTLFPPAPLIEEDEARNARRALELQDMLLTTELQFSEFSEWIVTHPLARALLQVCGNQLGPVGSFRRRRSIIFSDPAIAALAQQARDVFGGSRHAAKLAAGGESGGLTHLESIRRPGSREGIEMGRAGGNIMRQGALLARHASQRVSPDGAAGRVGSPTRSVRSHASGKRGGDTHLFTGIEDASSVGGTSTASGATSAGHRSGLSSRRGRHGSRRAEVSRARQMERIRQRDETMRALRKLALGAAFRCEDVKRLHLELVQASADGTVVSRWEWHSALALVISISLQARYEKMGRDMQLRSKERTRLKRYGKRKLGRHSGGDDGASQVSEASSTGASPTGNASVSSPEAATGTKSPAATTLKPLEGVGSQRVGNRGGGVLELYAFTSRSAAKAYLVSRRSSVSQATSLQDLMPPNLEDFLKEQRERARRDRSTFMDLVGIDSKAPSSVDAIPPPPTSEELVRLAESVFRGFDTAEEGLADILEVSIGLAKVAVDATTARLALIYDLWDEERSGQLPIQDLVSGLLGRRKVSQASQSPAGRRGSIVSSSMALAIAHSSPRLDKAEAQAAHGGSAAARGSQIDLIDESIKRRRAAMRDAPPAAAVFDPDDASEAEIELFIRNFVLMLDADGDGVVTRAEFVNALRREPMLIEVLADDYSERDASGTYIPAGSPRFDLRTFGLIVMKYSNDSSEGLHEHSGFARLARNRQSHGSGLLERVVSPSQFRQLLTDVFGAPRDAAPLIRRLYRLFDLDDNKRVTIREVFGGFQQATRGTAEERARFLFRLFDADGSGHLDQQELYRMLLFAQSKRDVDRYEALRVLDMLDKDKNGTVDEAEFVEGVSTDDDALAALSRVLGRTGIFGLAMQSKDARKTAASERQRESRRLPPPSSGAASGGGSGSESASRVAFVSAELGALGQDSATGTGAGSGAILTRPRGFSSATLEEHQRRLPPGSPPLRRADSGESNGGPAPPPMDLGPPRGREEAVHRSSPQKPESPLEARRPPSSPLVSSRALASHLPSPPPQPGASSSAEHPLTSMTSPPKAPRPPPKRPQFSAADTVGDAKSDDAPDSPSRSIAEMFASKRAGAKQNSSRSLLSGVSAQQSGGFPGMGGGARVPQFLGSLGRAKDSSRSLFGDEGGMISKGSLSEGVTEHTLPSLTQLMRQTEEMDGFGVADTTVGSLGIGDEDSRSLSRMLKTPPSTNGSVRRLNERREERRAGGRPTLRAAHRSVHMLPDVEEDVPVAEYESKLAESRVVEENVLAQTQTARQAGTWAVGQMDHALESLRSSYKKFEKKFQVTAKANADRRRKLATMDIRSSLARQYVGANRSEKRIGAMVKAGSSTSAAAIPFAQLDADSVGACLARIERLKHISSTSGDGDGGGLGSPKARKKVPRLNMRRVRSVQTLASSVGTISPRAGAGGSSGAQLLRTPMRAVGDTERSIGDLTAASPRQVLMSHASGVGSAATTTSSSRAQAMHAKAKLRQSRPFAQLSLSAAAQQAHWEEQSRMGREHRPEAVQSARLQASYSSESLLRGDESDMIPFDDRVAAGTKLDSARGSTSSRRQVGLGLADPSLLTVASARGAVSLSSSRSTHPEGFRPLVMREDLLPDASVRRSHSKAMLSQMQGLARKQPRAWKLSSDASAPGREVVEYDGNGRRVRGTQGLESEAFGTGVTPAKHASTDAASGKPSAAVAADGIEPPPAFGRRAARNSVFDKPAGDEYERPSNAAVSHRHLRRRQAEEEQARASADRPMFGAFGQLSRNTVKVLKGVRTTAGTADVLADGAQALAKASKTQVDRSMASMHSHAQADFGIKVEPSRGARRQAFEGSGGAARGAGSSRVAAALVSPRVEVPRGLGGFAAVSGGGVRGGAWKVAGAGAGRSRGAVGLGPQPAGSMSARLPARMREGRAGSSFRQSPRFEGGGRGGAFGRGSPRTSRPGRSGGFTVTSAGAFKGGFGSTSSRRALWKLEASAARAAERKSEGLRKIGEQLLKKGSHAATKGLRGPGGLSLYDPRKHAVSNQAQDEKKWLIGQIGVA